MQQDMFTQKLNQMDRAIVAITQQFPNTEYYHETLVISEEEANKISQIIATENPEPRNMPNAGPQQDQEDRANIDQDLPDMHNAQHR